jgi:hypothetical protein
LKNNKNVKHDVNAIKRLSPVDNKLIDQLFADHKIVVGKINKYIQDIELKIHNYKVK